ncbi:hypothetical protein NUW54_g13014 [Trametes sanguinea]|uniref:Uncharacterized protein n=1 Tax=Trametes sanguinea TaxID=158606 RepID=A0ACC1MQY7_9APHY|nr:hypothetical protein NUW54_g13014 [Trametes sanguinea]
MEDMCAREHAQVRGWLVPAVRSGKMAISTTRMGRERSEADDAVSAVLGKEGTEGWKCVDPIEQKSLIRAFLDVCILRKRDRLRPAEE